VYGFALISIITPVLNEEEYMKRFLNNIRCLNGEFEVIIVDGGSSDKTVEEAERSLRAIKKEIKIIKTIKNRAYQMNKGAEKARGDILLFLHIDCRIPKHSLRLVEDAIAQKKMIGGGFKQAFMSPDLFLKLMSIFGNLRVKLTKTFFGDYGIFIKRDIFDKLGGFDNITFLEDVEFCNKAKRYGKLDQINSPIFTSPRRYVKTGKIWLTIIFALAIFLNFLGYRPKFFTKYIVDK
jgi:rSAM/selenodomain-associated transferase 2